MGQGPAPPNPFMVERFQSVVSSLFQQVRQYCTFPLRGACGTSRHVILNATLRIDYTPGSFSGEWLGHRLVCCHGFWLLQGT